MGKGPEYFPSARASARIKLAAALGLPGRALTNIPARREIIARGLQYTGLYRTLIADAFGSGGIFYVEERFYVGDQRIQTDFGAIAPWYRFVQDRPELFNGLTQILTRVAVLQLWETYELPKSALNGTAALLADEGWQHDVLFSGEEDTYPDYPDVVRPLALQRLRQYPAAIIPVLDWNCPCDITANHAQLLMDYVDGGGRLIVFASDEAVDRLLSRAKNSTYAAFFQRLRSAPAQAGAGNLVRIREAWPTSYVQTTSSVLRTNLTALLEGLGVDRPLRLEGARRAVSAFARGNAQRLVVHLVNYDYDRASDHTNPVSGLVVSLAGVPADAVITAYAPDNPGGTGLAFEVRDQRAYVSVPRIDPWTVLSITFASPAGLSLAAAVLPGSRAVQVGASATVFAALIATGTGTATGCSVAPFTGMAANFLYQSTDRATNQLTGTPNTPVDIPAGSLRTFLIAFTPTAPFSSREVQLSFHCANAIDSPVIPGLNTLLLTSTSSTGPDIVALGTTVTNDGIADIPGTTGTGFFSVATVNVGASAPITATVDTGSATLPVVLSLCQTNPTTGVCLAAPASSAALTINAGATPTFAIFIQGTGNVAFDPGGNRVFVRFKTAAGATVGATSVAARTQ